MSDIPYDLFLNPSDQSKYLDQLSALVDSFPTSSSSSMRAAYHKILASVYANNIPEEKIAISKNKISPPTGTFLEYYGPYRNYRHAFCKLQKTRAVTEAEKRLKSHLPSLDFSRYSVAKMTDEIRRKVSVKIDSWKLEQDLSTVDKSIEKYCTQLYIATFEHEYTETASAIRAIPEAERVLAAKELDQLIRQGAFTANVNNAISQGGDSALRAEWFLFNLWTSLEILGLPDVNNAIQNYINEGLMVPPNIGPQNWDHGKYTSWYSPGTADFLSPATITERLKLLRYFYFAINIYPIGFEYVDNGYSLGFCEWSALARYAK